MGKETKRLFEEAYEKVIELQERDNKIKETVFTLKKGLTKEDISGEEKIRLCNKIITLLDGSE